MSKKQDCARTSSLLPLYASDDLNVTEMTGCDAHLDVCAGCRQELAAYAETLALLRQATAAPPAFDTEFFASVRHATLSSIQSDTRRAHITPTERFIRVPLATLKNFAHNTLRTSTSTPLFTTAPGRHALIASLACCALAALLYFAAREPVAQRDSVVTVENNTASSLTDNDSNDRLFTQHESQYGALRHTKPNGARRAYRQINKTGSRRAASSMSVTSSASLANKASVVSPADNNKQIATTAPVAAVSRIELQTADPNVRIIWLSPPSSPSPTTSPTSTSPTNAPPDDASPAIK